MIAGKDYCIAGAFVGQSQAFIESGKCDYPDCGCSVGLPRDGETKDEKIASLERELAEARRDTAKVMAHHVMESTPSHVATSEKPVAWMRDDPHLCLTVYVEPKELAGWIPLYAAPSAIALSNK